MNYLCAIYFARLLLHHPVLAAAQASLSRAFSFALFLSCSLSLPIVSGRLGHGVCRPLTIASEGRRFSLWNINSLSCSPYLGRLRGRCVLRMPRPHVNREEVCVCVCEQKQAQAHIGTPKAKGTHIKQSPQTTSRTKGKVKRELKTDAKINPSKNRIKKTLFLGFVLLPFQLFHSDV